MAALALAGCAPERPTSVAPIPTPPPTVGVPVLPATQVPLAPLIAKVPYPGGPLFQLPGDGNELAWTVDDGASYEAINAYIDFIEETGHRITFFIIGSYPAWQQAAPRLRPLVESGQVQIANHTHLHQSLTELSDAGIRKELLDCENVIIDTFGIDPKPYFRPPLGKRDARTDAVAASIGYTSPIMWFGTLGDAARKTPDEVVALANQYFQAQRVVIGHANYVGGVTAVFPQLNQFIEDRQLQTVTLNDVFDA